MLEFQTLQLQKMHMNKLLGNKCEMIKILFILSSTVCVN